MTHFVRRYSTEIVSLLLAVIGFSGPSFAQTNCSVTPTTPCLSTLMYFNGTSPAGGLTLGADGKLYGVGTESTFFGASGATGGLIYQLAPDASAVNTLYQYGRLGNFTGGGPRGPLVQDASGNFYGVTSYNRVDQFTSAHLGAGTVFKISPDGGTYTILHSFTDSADTVAPFTNADGLQPLASLVLANDGFLYGTTTQGGTFGFGTIFRIAPDGSGFAVLHNFASSTTSNGDTHQINDDGVQSISRMIVASNGDLYGTTLYGGVNGTGVIFRLHRDGSGFSVVLAFDASPAADATTGLQINNTGAYPGSTLLEINGFLYGTTQHEGANGFGTLYKIALDGTGFTVIRPFDSATGSNPAGDLILATDGTLVGTTQTGGTTTDSNGNAVAASGALYSITLDGTTFTDLYVFGSDGATPATGVLQLSDGSFYGTTSLAGPYNQGTVYRFGPPTNVQAQGTPQPYHSGELSLWILAALVLLFSWRLAYRKTTSTSSL